MNFWRELFGNSPIFNRRVERELEEKGIEPTQGVKKLESTRQRLRVIIPTVIVLVMIAFAGISFFKNKNNPTPNNGATPTTETKKQTQEKADTQNQTPTADYLLKTTADQRAKDATQAFNDWYTSFPNGKVVLEVNFENQSKTSPLEMQNKLIENLKQTFGTSVTDSFYTSLAQSLSFNPLTIDAEKGLTIEDTGDKENWLMTWFLDTKTTKANTQLILRNDFPTEWVDWRNKGQHDEKLGKIFSQIDWKNDLTYEVIGADLTTKNKNIENLKIVFLTMKYNPELKKWQVSGNIGGGK